MGQGKALWGSGRTSPRGCGHRPRFWPLTCPISRVGFSAVFALHQATQTVKLENLHSVLFTLDSGLFSPRTATFRLFPWFRYFAEAVMAYEWLKPGAEIQGVGTKGRICCFAVNPSNTGHLFVITARHIFPNNLKLAAMGNPDNKSEMVMLKYVANDSDLDTVVFEVPEDVTAQMTDQSFVERYSQREPMKIWNGNWWKLRQTQSYSQAQQLSSKSMFSYSLQGVQQDSKHTVSPDGFKQLQPPVDKTNPDNMLDPPTRVDVHLNDPSNQDIYFCQGQSGGPVMYTKKSGQLGYVGMASMGSGGPSSSALTIVPLKAIFQKFGLALATYQPTSAWRS